jgi:NAD(P)-dependent dehydrogenase (short-subunit alcohol dehydrogenase family)
LTDADVIPNRTRCSANSGRFDGACPHSDDVMPASRAAVMMRAMTSSTARPTRRTAPRTSRSRGRQAARAAERAAADQLEYATQGIRVNAVCPGVIDTEMVERFTGGTDEAVDQMLQIEPVGRMGSPDDVADAMVWLCSDRASFVTGDAIAVDGGAIAR